MEGRGQVQSHEPWGGGSQLPSYNLNVANFQRLGTLASLSVKEKSIKSLIMLERIAENQTS